MVKSSVRPSHRVVTHLAGRWKSGLDMIYGRNGIVVILLMAGYAGRRRQVVVIVDVAIDALPRGNGMRPGKRKSSRRVVELRSRPARCAVTRIASLREPARYVVRIRSALVVLQVA